LKALDFKLVENAYLCGNKLTLGDLVVFNDLAMYMELKGYTIESKELGEYPNLTKWFNLKMLQNPLVKEVYLDMKESLKKAKKNQPSS
jgi:glutathione S-transferase